jgi:hypothetical protein
MAFERVYTVWDYHDSPRSGIADYLGKPHYYECEWDAGTDDYSDTFSLKPVDEKTLALALEQWSIWRNWEFAFHRGEKRQETHPKLPGQSKRYAELDAELEARLARLTPEIKVYGNFRARSDQPEIPGHAMRELEVEWTDGT